MIDLTKALESLCPGAQWTLVGNSYEGLTWLDETKLKPSKEALESEAARLQPIIECQANRVKEYPSIQEQLDMQYWDLVNGTNTWQDAINAVKAKYPKG